MKLPARQSTPSRAAAPQESLGMLTRQELAKQLRISTRTVDEWRQDKVIPCIKVGKVVLFYWPDVVSALREKYSVASAKAESAKAETLKVGLRDGRTAGP
jgi:excisionase family DNA binding protein